MTLEMISFVDKAEMMIQGLCGAAAALETADYITSAATAV